MVTHHLKNSGSASVCMAKYVCLLPLLIVLIVPNNLYRGEAILFTIENNCTYTVWPAIISTGKVSLPNDSYGGFSLANGASRTIDLPTKMTITGRIIGRTECSTNTSTGEFSCQSGDCGSGKINCDVLDSNSPLTLIEFDKLSTNEVNYEVSVDMGYNLPITMAPRGGTGRQCAITGCVFNLTDSCPDNLRVVNTKGTIIGCESPCPGLNDITQQVGCQGDADIFNKSCPRASSSQSNSPLDGSLTSFICSGSELSYTITFCPPPSLSSLISQPFSSRIFSKTGSPSPSPSSPPLLGTPSKPKAFTGDSKRRRLWLIVGLAISAAISILLLYGVWSCVRRKKGVKTSSLEVFELKKAAMDSLQFDLHTIQEATRNFAADNKLGEGGFGEVYKGILENGQEIAVKRLSSNSRQGNAEFKNEVALVAKLRHKNLVTLLGFCVSSEEKILVYEFLAKSSLDRFLNDQTLRQTSLNWQTRFKIIVGIARGLLYLHEDSPFKIIHRDLKSSNILLDDDMNPKIADFGLAKLFGVDQTQGDTKRIVGTYGYMAPEYAITGHYSVRSDVYSFGVIILEMVSGQMNRFFGRLQLEEALLHRAWRLWNEGESIALVDKTLDNEEFSREEVSKCIHIGLLCIQEDATLRPRMTSIVAVLNGQANNFPMPKPPNFFGINVDDNDIQHNSDGIYRGSITITDLYLRD